MLPEIYEPHICEIFNLSYCSYFNKVNICHLTENGYRCL